eukprot:Selendium_serpulae@DN6925_c0_g1_i1.p1
MNQKLRWEGEEPMIPETTAGFSVFDRDACQGIRPRVLVLGDSEVGKTSLMRMLCSNQSIAPLRLGTARDVPPEPKWMQNKESSVWPLRDLGCEVHVAVYSGRCFEFWDINGDRSHVGVRSVFYDNFDALFLVYDVSNLKSYHNLVQWLYELLSRHVPPSAAYFNEITDGKFFDAEDPPRIQRTVSTIPIRVIANKCDTLKDNFIPRPAEAKFVHNKSIMDRLFGGMDKFVEGLWESRLTSKDRVQALQLSCQTLDKAKQLAFSAKYNEGDVEGLDMFFQQLVPSTQ